MLVGVMSDTHDRLEMLGKAVKVFKKEGVEMLVHCGDWVSPFTLEYFDQVCGEWRVPVKSVFGNNEGDIKRILERSAELTNPIEWAQKWVMELDFDGKKVAVFHGHDKAILVALIESQKYDAVFTGHTHAARNELVGKALVLNPGSTSLARESKIVKDASVAVYESKTNEARVIGLVVGE